MEFTSRIFISKGIITVYVIISVTFLLSVMGGEGFVENLGCTADASKNETDLRLRFGHYLTNDDEIGAYYIHPLLTNNIDIQKHSTELTSGIYGNRRCTKVLKRKKYRNLLMNRSMCPWYIVLTVDENRYPVSMATARCTCKKCYDSDGKQPPVGKVASRCAPINIKVKVLRQQFANGSRKCVRNTFLYEESYEEVAVGCTCKVRPKTKSVVSES